MINHWILTGDTHGGAQASIRITNLLRNMQLDKATTGIIILGDAGFNYYLNKTDKKWKKIINDYGVYVYCVRGNHEARPEDIEGMVLLEDENVQNCVWYEPNYPHIRYFSDGATYRLTHENHEYKTLVIGGAYSIDKYWRLERGAEWFANEQLSQEEMDKISYIYDGEHFDFVLSHTCPLSWQPTDLFLSFVNQEQVDNTMEKWMEELRHRIDFDYWCFGHYHANQIVRPGVEMYYGDSESLSTIVERWKRYDLKGELDWWLQKSPNFYMGR